MMAAHDFLPSGTDPWIRCVDGNLYI